MRACWLSFLSYFSYSLQPPCLPDGVVSKLHPLLKDLTTTIYFKYHKVDLHKNCPFWNESPKCTDQSCTVNEPNEREKEALAFDMGRVTFPKNEGNLFFFNTIEDHEFCVADDDSSGVYVDLVKNPERFTGYEGDHANKVWNAIYNQNCFVSDNPLAIPQCLEREAFHKIVSGMHASISTHIAANFYNQETKTWEMNPKLFWSRVGNFPERIENLKFAFSILLRAVSKLGSYVEQYDFQGISAQEKQQIKQIIAQIVQLSAETPHVESNMFADPNSAQTKELLRKYFLNISKIMDCLACEKCRLWGKIQTKGIGTALKILFSFPATTDQSLDYHLTRTEIVALFNTLNRFATSIQNITSFQQMKDLESKAQSLVGSTFSGRKVARVCLVGAAGAMTLAKWQLKKASRH